MGSKTLLVTGIVCVIAAIVGGGLEARDIKVPVIASVRRQVLLGTFGLLVAILGLIPPPGTSGHDSANPVAQVNGAPVPEAPAAPTGTEPDTPTPNYPGLGDDALRLIDANATCDQVKDDQPVAAKDELSIDLSPGHVIRSREQTVSGRARVGTGQHLYVVGWNASACKYYLNTDGVHLSSGGTWTTTVFSSGSHGAGAICLLRVDDRGAGLIERIDRMSPNGQGSYLRHFPGGTEIARVLVVVDLET